MEFQAPGRRRPQSAAHDRGARGENRGGIGGGGPIGVPPPPDPPHPPALITRGARGRPVLADFFRASPV
jgi:hypothetical protein